MLLSGYNGYSIRTVRHWWTTFGGKVADDFGRRTRLPRVTLLIVFGVIAGPTP
jgi:hypothetical protein